MKPQILFLLTFLLVSVSLPGCTQSPDPKLPFQLLTYGEPGPKNIRDFVAERWAIEYISIGGCTVNKSLIDSANQHNAIVKKSIAKKYGPDWEERFEHDLRTEIENEEKAAALVDSVYSIEQLRTELRTERKYLTMTSSLASNSTKYNVLVRYQDANMKENREVTLYKLVVDLKTRTITPVD